MVLSFIDDCQTLAADFVAATRNGTIEAHIWDGGQRRLLGTFSDVTSARVAIVRYHDHQQQHYGRLGGTAPTVIL